jgi:glycosyltransferase involved in cell wall biosynthesis
MSAAAAFKNTVPKLPILHEARTLISAGLFDRVFLNDSFSRRELLADDKDLERLEFVPLATVRSFSRVQLLRSLLVTSNIQEAVDATQMFRSRGVNRLPFLHLENIESHKDLVNLVSEASSIADRFAISDSRLEFRRVGKHNAYDVSIIVPVYGVAAYIERCARSLKNQSFVGRSQILFIDDGSCDGSAEIIRRVVEGADHMKLVFKPNGGAASARNVGLDLAQGEFVGFVDGDDYVSEEFIDSLYRAAILNDCDVAQGEFFYVNAKDGTMSRHPECFSVELGALGVISTPSYPMMLQTPAIWRRLYSRHLIQSNGVRFNESFRRHDDLPFNIEVLSKSQQIAIVRKPIYYYLLGREGQDVSATDERLFIHFRLFEFTRSRIGRRYWERDYFRKFTVTMFAHHLWAYERIEPRLKERYLNGMAVQTLCTRGPIGALDRLKVLLSHFRAHRRLVLRCAVLAFRDRRRAILPSDTEADARALMLATN